MVWVGALCHWRAPPWRRAPGRGLDSGPSSHHQPWGPWKPSTFSEWASGFFRSKVGIQMGPVFLDKSLWELRKYINQEYKVGLCTCLISILICLILDRWSLSLFLTMAALIEHLLHPNIYRWPLAIPLNNCKRLVLLSPFHQRGWTLERWWFWGHRAVSGRKTKVSNPHPSCAAVWLPSVMASG